MSFGGTLWEPERCFAACVAVAVAILLAAVPAASADTAFGGNPDQEVVPEITSEVSCAPFTCTLSWTGPAGSDTVPIGPGGGVGTVTGVTLPPLVNPGTMQAVVLTSTTTATKDPSAPSIVCCRAKEVSEPFTVPPNQVTTVPLALHVSATAAANLGVPGDVAEADAVGISITTAEASAPLRMSEDPADLTKLWAPALTAPTSTSTAPLTERNGFELAARFTYLPTPGAKPPTAEEPGAPGAGTTPVSGLLLHHGVLRPGRDGRTVVLGTAADPPTASTRQTLSAAPPASASATGGKAKKPRVLGLGRTTVPDGRKATLKLALNRRARVALARDRRLRATLTIVAIDPGGKAETVTRRVTIKPTAEPGRPR